MQLQALFIILQPSVNSNWSNSPETLHLCQNRQFFCPVWPWILMDDLEKNNLRHLLYATASFVHHFIAMSEFKLELQSGNIQIGAIFFYLCDLDFDLWPWPLAWASFLSMAITPENFMMIQWQELTLWRRRHRWMDRRTDRSVLRAAWLQLK